MINQSISPSLSGQTISKHPHWAGAPAIFNPAPPGQHPRGKDGRRMWESGVWGCAARLSQPTLGPDPASPLGYLWSSGEACAEPWMALVNRLDDEHACERTSWGGEVTLPASSLVLADAWQPGAAAYWRPQSQAARPSRGLSSLGLSGYSIRGSPVGCALLGCAGCTL